MLGTRFSTSVVAGLVGQSEAVSLAALDALCRAGLVRGTPCDDAEFVHPLFREALYEDMPEPVRRAMHTQAFRVLHARGAPAAASHAVAAGMRGDPEAIGALAEAGRVSVAAGALATAVEHLKSAVGMAEGSAPLGLQIELAQAELAIGHATEAEEVTKVLLKMNESIRFPHWCERKKTPIRLSDYDERRSDVLSAVRQFMVLTTEDLARLRKPKMAIRQGDGPPR